MEKHLIISLIEVAGGKDKDPSTGHRWDTPLIADALKALGCETFVYFYTDDGRHALADEIKNNGSVAYISRLDPGKYDNYTEGIYLRFLEGLLEHGLTGFSTPKQMFALGTKEVLWRLRDTRLGVGEENVRVFRTKEELDSGFWEFLVSAPKEEGRVLKQNRGAGGLGTYWVRVQGEVGSERASAHVLVREAHDAKQREYTWGEFVDVMSSQHLDSTKEGESVEGKHLLVAVPFFSGIKNGERRLIATGERVVAVVDKQGVPAEDGKYFSCTGRAGATHTYLYGDDWEGKEPWVTLTHLLEENIADIKTLTGLRELPPLWTADFIQVADGEGRYVIGECNCSCFGFGAKQPNVAKAFAEEIVRRLKLGVRVECERPYVQHM
eukprot:comp39955_c0_seq1/m.47408 comp39955_c0_seq1/g.47408  ORF comp39955_c0_seq1/g.47408 comp39955_c0_seq1/m.47408 type:complete len:381 (-) comp39955_c0_seq1:555-1697(-)